jgi:diadenylate cyclase
MIPALEFLRNVVVSFDLRAFFDVLVVAAIIYSLLRLIQGTTADALLRGIVIVFFVGSAVSSIFGLTMLGWLLKNALPALFVAIPVLFAPEIRRVLEQIGRSRGISRTSVAATNQGTIDIMAESAGRLAERRWGAILVIERQIGLGEYADTGVRIDGVLSIEFLLSIFYPHSPLHDGAVIIRGDRVVSAGCVLPLAETIQTGHQFGTRHRAAMGITSKTDALALVVSEETGQISIANNGRLVRNLDDQKLRRILPMLIKSGTSEGIPPLFRLRVTSPTS